MKTFDCVDMKRRGSEVVNEKTAGLTAEQEVAFWIAESTALRKRRAALLRRRGVRQTPSKAKAG